VSILLGSSLCLGVIVFGWLPPSFGLGWWASVSSVVAGILVGIAFTAPLALVSLRTATNLSTSSGARFGVRGRLVGSVGGPAPRPRPHHADGVDRRRCDGQCPRPAVRPARERGVVRRGPRPATAATVAGAVHGYRVLLAVSRILAIGMTALLVLGVIAYAPDFTTGALKETGGYPLGGFWPTWVLAAVTAGLSGPVAGFARCRGVYDAEALQVFNRRARGGTYWFTAGWNIPATASWALGAVAGVLAVTLPFVRGPAAGADRRDRLQLPAVGSGRRPGVPADPAQGEGRRGGGLHDGPGDSRPSGARACARSAAPPRGARPATTDPQTADRVSRAGASTHACPRPCRAGCRGAPGAVEA
jgi:hypothetical protein